MHALFLGGRRHPVGHLRMHIHDRRQELVHHLGPALLARLLDLLDLGLGLLVSVLFGLFVTTRVLSECQPPWSS